MPWCSQTQKEVWFPTINDPAHPENTTLSRDPFMSRPTMAGERHTGDILHKAANFRF